MRSASARNLSNSSMGSTSGAPGFGPHWRQVAATARRAASPGLVGLAIAGRSLHGLQPTPGANPEASPEGAPRVFARTGSEVRWPHLALRLLFQGAQHFRQGQPALGVRRVATDVSSPVGYAPLAPRGTTRRRT